MDANNFYVLTAAGGLIVLHASQVQPKNTSSVLIANLLGIAFATISYWACGFAFAVGSGATGKDAFNNVFLSYQRFFLMDATGSDMDKFVDTLCILLLVIVICNSGFLARMRCWIYPIVIVVIAGLLYPCAYHWVYDPVGWLREGIDQTFETTHPTVKQRKLLYVDEGKVGVIHIFGGTCALIGTIIIGTRKERKDKKFAALGGNLNPLIVVGGILALVGLIAKNSSIEQVDVTHAKLANSYINKPQDAAMYKSLAFLNTMLSAQASAIIAFTLKRTKICGDPSGTKALINGALAGVVGVSCAPHQYHPYAGLVIGVVSGLAFTAWTALFHCCRIDDPTDSAAIHLGAGIWGALAGPIFRKDAGVIAANGSIFKMQMFGWQMLGALAIFVWAGLTLFIIVVPFLLCRIATYKETAYEEGLDVFEYEDPAYPGSSYPGTPQDGSTIDENVPVVGKSFQIRSYNGARAIHQELSVPSEWYGFPDH